MAATDGDLGRLFFTLGLDDKEFEKKIEAVGKKIEKSLNGNTDTSKYIKNVKDKTAAEANLIDTVIKKRAELRRREEADHQKAVARFKQLQNLQQSKQLTGTMLESTAQIGVRSDAIKSMKRYYEEEARGATKAAREKAKLDKHTQNLTKSQKGLGLSLLFSNGQMRSSVRLSTSLGNQMSTLFSVYAVERFIKSLVEVRGEFELQQVALRAILRDIGGADKLFSQLQGLAVKSPFLFKDLVGYAKQLSAFSVPLEELYDTTKRLADVSSGLGVDMSRIIIAYGQVKSAAVLRGQELRQFTEAGIPLVDELAKKFTELNGELVNAGEVFDLISKRQVPFEMIKEVFEDMTSAGGMFYEMQEKQAETLKGKISNLTDVFHQALNSMGQDYDSVLKKGVDFATSLAKNFEKVVKVLGSLVFVLGTYKAASIAAFGFASVANIVNNIKQFQQLIKTMKAAEAAQKAFNITQASNVGLAAIQGVIILLGTLFTAIQVFKKEVKSATEIANDLTIAANQFSEQEKKMEDLISTYEELDAKIKSGKLVTEARTEAEKRRTAVVTEINKVTGVAIKREDEYGKILTINIDKVKKYNAAQREIAKESAQMGLAEAEKTLNEKQGRLGLLTARIAAPEGSMSFKYKGYKYPTKGGMFKDRSDVVKEASMLQAEVQTLSEAVESYRNLLNAIKAVETEGNKVADDWRGKLRVKIQGLADSGKVSSTMALSEVPKADEGLVEYLQRVDEATKEQKKIYEDMAGTAKASGAFTDAQVDSQRKIYESYKLLSKFVGVPVEKTTGGGEKGEDPARVRLKLLEDSYKAYQKLTDTMTSADALAKVKGMPQFAGLTIPTDSESYTKALEGLLKNASKDATVVIKEKISDSIVDGIIEAEKKAKEALDKFAPMFNFYEKLRELTGNEKFSRETAFGSAFNQDLFDKSQTESTLKRREDLILSIEQARQEQMSVEEKVALERQKQLDIELQIGEIYKDNEEGKQRAIDTTRKASQKAIEELMTESFMLSDVYKRLFADISDMSVSTLKNLLSETNAIIDSATYDKNIGKYITSVDGQRKELTPAAYNQLIKKAAEFKSKLKDFEPFKNLFKPDGESFEDKAKGVEDSLGQIASMAQSVVSVFSELSDVLGFKGKASFEAASSALQGLTDAGMGAARIMAGDVTGGSVQAIQGAGGLIGAVVNFANIGVNKKIDEITESINDLEYALSELNDQREKGGAFAAFESDKQIVANLQAQIDANNELIAQEEKKAENTNKALKGIGTYLAFMTKNPYVGTLFTKIFGVEADTEELEREAKEKADAIRDIYLDALEATLGTAQSLASTLGDALIDAFKNGESGAMAWGDTVRKIMADLGQKLLIDKFLTPEIEKLINSYEGRLTTNGALDPNKLLNEIPNLERDLTKLEGKGNLLMEALRKAGLISYGNTAETLTQTMQGLTEDTGNKLVGYMNQVRADVAAKRRLLETIVADMRASGIKVTDERAIGQLISINEKLDESNRNTLAIRNALDSVVGVKGSTGKGIRVI